MNGVMWYYIQKTVDGIMTIIDEKIDKISKNVENKLVKKLIKKWIDKRPKKRTFIFSIICIKNIVIALYLIQ